MKKKRSIFFKTLMVLIVLLALFLLFELGIYRLIAINHVKDYMYKQGAQEENIESMELAWDPLKTGGYNFRVKFKDDPEYEYFYNYRLFKINDFGIDNTVRFEASKDGMANVQGGKYKELR